MPKNKFNPKVINTIYAALAQGNYLKTAAAAAGISYRTVLYWMKAGKTGESQAHVNFYTEVKRIQATWEANTVKELSEYGNEKIKLEMLARKNPEQWAATSRTIHIVEEKLEEFMDFIVAELASDQLVLKRFLEAAEKYDVRE